MTIFKQVQVSIFGIDLSPFNRRLNEGNVFKAPPGERFWVGQRAGVSEKLTVKGDGLVACVIPEGKVSKSSRPGARIKRRIVRIEGSSLNRRGREISRDRRYLGGLIFTREILFHRKES